MDEDWHDRGREPPGIWFLENFMGPFLKWFFMIYAGVILLIIAAVLL
jgi:hypothetical protein